MLCAPMHFKTGEVHRWLKENAAAPQTIEEVQKNRQSRRSWRGKSKNALASRLTYLDLDLVDIGRLYVMSVKKNRKMQRKGSTYQVAYDYLRIPISSGWSTWYYGPNISSSSLSTLLDSSYGCCSGRFSRVGGATASTSATPGRMTTSAEDFIQRLIELFRHSEDYDETVIDL